MKKEYSAGGYVIHNHRLLMIETYHNKQTEISIPKGHIDPGEDKLTAAKREIAEETGYTNLKLIKELPADKYQFTSKTGEVIDKTIYQFLFELTDELQVKQQLDKYEQIKPIWVDLAKADQLASFTNTKQIIKELQTLYKN